VGIKKKPFREPGFQLFLFVLSMLLFNWPLMRIAGEKSSGVFFIYLYLVWIFVIVLLALIGRSLGASSDPKTEQSDRTRSVNV